MTNWESFYAEFREPGFVPGYEIQDHLGGGAFGEVYRATKSSIGKTFAIKFLKLGLEGSSGGVERELEHVRLFAEIDHPNLVTIEDMGVARDVPYLVMGYAGEDTLARRIGDRNLGQDLALRLFVQVARGVNALHDRSLAHFDLKPGNIFLNGENARVGDYGLAKLLSDGRQTLSAGRGTPQYMAPEMLRNRADTRADIYSMGVILYESLAFRLPYLSGGGLGVVLRESDEPPPIPEGFPRALIPVVSRCLRLDPEDRYSTVRELLLAMGQTTEGESVAHGLLEHGPEPPPLPTPLPAPLPAKSAGSVTSQGDPAISRLRSDSLTRARAWSDSDLDSDIVSSASLDEPEESSVPREPDPPTKTGPPTPRESLRSEPLGTIPVPPRSDSGAFGTLWEIGVLGIEMLGALISWPLGIGTRFLAQIADRVARSVPGLAGVFLRGFVIFLCCFLLGGIAAVVLVLAFTLFAA